MNRQQAVRPRVKEVHPRIFRARLPLPFALNHVNVYLIQGAEGWQVVDTGLHTAEGEAAWEEVIQTLSIKPEQVKAIRVTHAHPDHIGMAGWLQQRLKGYPEVVMSRQTRAYMEYLWVHPEAWMAAMAGYLRRIGATEEIREQLLQNMEIMRTRVRPLPERIRTLRPHTTVRMGDAFCRVLPAPGHSDDQVIYYQPEQQHLFVGDQILLRITPNIGLWPGSQPGVLRRYLQSLRTLRRLPIKVAFPGHYGVIDHVAERIDELIAHHRQRLADMCRAVAEGASTVLEVAMRVFSFDRLTSHEVRFALAETFAHLEHLVEEGLLAREEVAGVWQYRTCRLNPVLPLGDGSG